MALKASSLLAIETNHFNLCQGKGLAAYGVDVIVNAYQELFSSHVVQVQGQGALSLQETWLIAYQLMASLPK